MGNYTRAARIAVLGLAAIFVIVGLILGGLRMIVATKLQSEENARLIKSEKNVDKRQEDMLRIILAVTGCTVNDSPEECTEKQQQRSRKEGELRLRGVECIVRSIERGESQPVTIRKCQVV